ncbi:AraC family transcriptional regulator [Bordetella genomosp. 10]|uniref:AraC family transcriptional regulator n=1 Tax=Bordetella genomosp. 10 TaxID=1416804 RepID=A0A261S111_9BORD|nr:helix-turn-helix transcriptional regulator [Bordetella genomosp. 10]OZI30612.1 AraC family transcriptional regulator [Bordetella genomosp. 10]
MDNIWRQRFGAGYQRQSWPVMGWGKRYRGGQREIWHSHEQGQLVYPGQGVVRVLTSVGAWTVTPVQGLWIASGVDHELHMIGAVHLLTLRVEPDAAPWLWPECRLVEVQPLLRELLLAMTADPFEYAADSNAALIAPLALRCLGSAATLDHGKLPLPSDKRLLRVCEMLMQSPASDNTLEHLSTLVGASARTLARLFQAETGLTFGQWRRQLRLSEAVCQLSLGASVSSVARGLGYANPNAFTAMFRKALGAPPQRYMRGL